MLPAAVLEQLITQGYLCDRPAIQQLHGGNSNTVLRLNDGKETFVLKLNQASILPEMFAREASALQYLSEHAPLRYPAVITHGIAIDYQYLLLEYLEEGGASEDKLCMFGRQLAEQHRISHAQFGWQEDNYIGRLLQPNKTAAHWIDFFLDQRILPQVSMAIRNGLLAKEWVDKLNENRASLKAFFPAEPPALLHGDLWGGNYFFGKEEVVLYDPALYFGHRELDLAMTLLFGGFDQAFYSAYHESYPIDAGWMDRLPVTQLYPNLVHLNLFGSSYLGLVQQGLRYLTAHS